MLYKNEAWLMEQYWHKKLSMNQIAEQYRHSKNTLKKYMDKFNIPRRTVSEARLVRFYKPQWDKKWLHEMYVKKKFSINEVSRLCHCDPKVVRDWLKRHGIETRTKAEAYRVRRKANIRKFYGSTWNRLLLIVKDFLKSIKRYF